MFFGGVSTGKSVVDNCDVVVDSPQMRFCHVTDNPSTQVKFAGSYPLPWWGIEASAVFQNLPGVDRLATFVATNAMIAPSLGRNLGQCGAAATCNGTVIVDLVERRARTANPGRISSTCALAARMSHGKRCSSDLRFDIYNLTNANDIQSMNTRYGTTWLNATSILPGRTFKVGVRTEF